MDDGDRGLKVTDMLFQAAMENHKLRPVGIGQLMYCEDCGEEIPKARRDAYPGCTRCTICQTEFERMA